MSNRYTIPPNTLPFFFHQGVIHAIGITGDGEFTVCGVVYIDEPGGFNGGKEHHLDPSTRVTCENCCRVIEKVSKFKCAPLKKRLPPGTILDWEDEE